MLKQSLFILSSLIITACAYAVEPVATDAPAANPHRSRDAKMRLCKAEADQQQLAGDARSAYIAACMKK